MRKLYLDDNRKVPDGWALVKTYYHFVKAIEKFGLPDVISFDHDLADEHVKDFVSKIKSRPLEKVLLNYQGYQEKTGYDAAVWLVNFCMEHKLEMPQCIVHSHNVVGAENIKCLINNYYKTFNIDKVCEVKRA